MLIGKKPQSDEEAAEMMMRHRARILPAITILFAFMQALLTYKLAIDSDLKQASWSAWLLIGVVLLWSVFNGGGGRIERRYPGMRKFLDDELTCIHRLKASSAGFRAMMLAALGMMVASFWQDFSSLLALHLVVGIGVAATAMRYALLERGALNS